MTIAAAMVNGTLPAVLALLALIVNVHDAGKRGAKLGSKVCYLQIAADERWIHSGWQRLTLTSSLLTLVAICHEIRW